MTTQILKAERGVSVSHCVIVQCPPLAKNFHLKEQQVLWKVTLQTKSQKIPSKKTSEAVSNYLKMLLHNGTNLS